MTLSISKRILIGAVSLAVVGLLSIILILIAMQAARSSLNDVVNEYEPISAAAYEMEINVIGTGLGVKNYLTTCDIQYRRRVEKDRNDFGRFKRQYDSLSVSPRLLFLSSRVDSLFDRYTALGYQMMNTEDSLRSRLSILTGRFVRMDDVLDEQLKISRRESGSSDMLWAYLMEDLESEVAETGIWFGLHLMNPDHAGVDRIYDNANDFREGFNETMQTPMSARERKLLREVALEFDRTMVDIDDVLSLTDRKLKDMDEFLALREEIDFLLDDAIQTEIVKLLEQSKTNATDTTNVVLGMLAFLIPLYVVASGGAGVFLVRLINKPIKELVQATQAVGTGDLAFRLPIARQDEFGLLAKNFNAMTSHLEEITVSRDSLEESEHRFRELFDEAPVGYHEIDGDGKIVRVNWTELNMLGYSREEMVGRFVWEFAADENEMRRDISEELAGGQPLSEDLECQYRRSNGTLIWVLSKDKVFYDEYRRVTKIRTTIQDITEWKKALEMIQEQASLLEAARESIVVLDLTGKVLFWNNASEISFGISSRDALGHLLDDFMIPELVLQFRKGLETSISTGGWKGEITFMSGGGIERIFESRQTLVFDGENRPKSILILNNDVSEKKRLQQQLLRSQRMESIGTLAAGIAHDMNNLLTPIALSVDVLRTESMDEKTRRVLQVIESSATRAKEIVRQMLTFSRGIESERDLVNVEELIEDMGQIARETFHRSIVLNTEVEENIWPVSGNRTLLHQVLMNLSLNAKDAMPRGGTITISAKKLKVDETVKHTLPVLKEEKYIVLKVTDTGEGIPEALRGRIFDPFFSTKDVGKGTGLGLSTVLGIVRSHSGFLDLTSEVGKGTEFTIYLPAIDAPVAIAEARREIEMTRGSGLILVIDDEDLNLELVSEVLQSAGYRVFTARNGTEGVELYRAHMNEVSVVLVDLNMPGLSGEATIRELANIKNTVKTIVCSGLVSPEAKASIPNEFVYGWVEKPFSAAHLRHVIADVLKG